MNQRRLAELAISGSGSHTIYTDDDDAFTVEWYDFGPNVPYESANMLTFTTDQQAALAAALALDWTAPDMQSLADALARRFQSYFEIRKFAEKRNLHFSRAVDFMP